MPAVSVIIPTFNRAPLVLQAIRSVLAQTFGDLEVVVVDDASTDGTPDAIEKEFGAELRTGRLVYLRNDSHQERSLTRNRGIEAARGRYLAFVDDDDLFLPRHLECCLRQLKKCDVVAAGVMLIDAVGNPVREYTFPFLGRLDARELALLGLGINNSNGMLRRDVLDRSGPFRLGLDQGEDIDFWMRVAMSAAIGLSPDTTVLRRVHPGNYTFDAAQAMHVRFLDGLKAMLIDNSERLGCELSPRVLGYLHLYIAWNGICQGRRQYAFERLREALRFYPRLAFVEPYFFRLLGRMVLLSDPRLREFLRKTKRLWKHRASAS